MGLLSVEEARSRVLAQVTPLTTERVELDQALGRALAEPLTATRTLPPWDNSAMDGYAVRSVDGRGPLRVIETIFAGQAPRLSLAPGTCARIMTGAQVPQGADAVVMQEKALALVDGTVELLEPASTGFNIRRRGEDVAEGAPLFGAGQPLGLGEAGVLWAQGLTEVLVHRRPRVAIASSGDELVDVGASVDRSRIIDTNSPVIAAAARAAGAQVTRLGRAPDSLEAMKALFAPGLEGHDVLISLAGASVGERDFTREAFAALGVTMDFWKVAMKPGKPLALGRRGGTLVFGLPGNPISAMVTYELFVRPALRKLQGLPPGPVTLPARAAVDLPRTGAVRLYLRATLETVDGALEATPVASQSSGALTSAAGATCLIDLPPESPAPKKGSAINVLPLSWASI